MKLIFKYKNHDNPNTYFSFCFFDFTFINTYQVWSINLTAFNFLFKILKEKRQNKQSEITPARSLEEVEEWSKRQLERSVYK